MTGKFFSAADARMQPLRQAACTGSFQDFKRLCNEAGVDVNAAGEISGRVPLHWSAFVLDNQKVSYLLNAKGAEVNPIDKLGLDNPLNLAVQSVNQPHGSIKLMLPVADTLLAHNADPNCPNRDGLTALMHLIMIREGVHSSQIHLIRGIDAVCQRMKKMIYIRAHETGERFAPMSLNGESIPGPRVCDLSMAPHLAPQNSALLAQVGFRAAR